MNHQGTKTPREEIATETGEVATQVVDAALAVHGELGPGLLINFNVRLMKDGLKRMIL